jgi:hypothetical protein
MCREIGKRCSYPKLLNEFRRNLKCEAWLETFDYASTSVHEDDRSKLNLFYPRHIFFWKWKFYSYLKSVNVCCIFLCNSAQDLKLWWLNLWGCGCLRYSVVWREWGIVQNFNKETYKWRTLGVLNNSKEYFRVWTESKWVMTVCREHINESSS